MKTAKFWVALVGAVAVTLSGYFAPDATAGRVITAVIAVTTAVSVYLVPNAPAVTPPADGSLRRTY